MVSRRGSQFLGLLSALAIVVAVGVAPAEAIPIIKFDQGFDQSVQGGVISWGGGTDPLVGADIGFSVIVGLDDLAGMGLLCDPLVSGLGRPCMMLNFETGPFAGVSGGTLSWDGGVGATFTVTLTHDDALIGPGGALDIDAGEALLTGTAMFGADLLPPGGGFRNLSITGLDFKHPEILGFFFPAGAPEDFAFSSTEITLSSGPIDLDAGFEAIDVSDADINNKPVPVPATSLLLLLGLGGLAVRKRFM